jgi:hypothetical protein
MYVQATACVKRHKVVRTQRPVYKAQRAVLDDFTSILIDAKSSILLKLT